MRKRVGQLRRLLQAQEGQATFEFMLLMILSIVAGFLLLMALGQVVDALYGRLEGEVSRPSHH